MPAVKKYKDFKVSEPYQKLAKFMPTMPGEMRSYVSVTCPHCNEQFKELPESSLVSQKAGVCLEHLRTCERAKDGGFVPPTKRSRTAASTTAANIAGMNTVPIVVVLKQTETEHPTIATFNVPQTTTKSTAEAPVATASDTDRLVEHTVYGMLYLKRSVYVYVGSTENRCRRFAAHANCTSGCRRVAIALAQQSAQPFDDHFPLEELWTGECTARQARAIEQFLINKYNTRVFPRPTNGVTRDIDLIGGAEPRQLNVAQACVDPALLEWAERRVTTDLQIVKVRAPYDQLALTNLLAEILMDGATRLADEVASTRVSELVGFFAALDPEQRVPVVEVHRALVQVRDAVGDDDGQDVRDMVDHHLKLYNVDHSPDRVLRAAVVASVFKTLAACVGVL